MWIAVLPIASAYALTARQAGFSLPETQLMSAVIFSAPVQINLVNLLASGAPVMTILGTSIVLMLQATFYGVSLRQRIPLSRAERHSAAGFLTDSAYGLTMVLGQRASFAYLLGAELSMFAAWNLFTLIGAFLSPTVALLMPADLSAAAPLTFFAMLVLTVESRQDAVAAVLGGVIMLAARPILPGSLALMLAIAVPVVLSAAWRNR
jgi:predicted branched-subunit amino acid permease